MSSTRPKPLLAILTLCALMMPAALRAQAPHASTTGPLTFIIGKVTVADPRILDVTGGPYDFDGANHDIRLGLIQDPRGHLIATGTLTLNNGVTQPIRLNGRLNVTSTGPLMLALHNQPFMPPMPPVPSAAPDASVVPTTGPLLVIMGVLDGHAFQCRVVAMNFAPGLEEEFEAPLEPKKPARGLVVQPAPVRQIAPGVFVSVRRIDLPWGPVFLPAIQRPAPGKGIVFNVPDPRRRQTPLLRLPLALEVAGTPDTQGGFIVDRSRVMLPYGIVLAQPQDTEVLPLPPVVPQSPASGSPNP